MSGDPGTAHFSPDWSEDIADEWAALSRHAKHFRQTPAWVSGIPSHVAMYAPESQLEWFCYDDGRGSRAAMVFRRSSARLFGGISLNILRPVSRHGFVLSDALMTPEVDIAKLAAIFQRTRLAHGSPWHILELARLRETSQLLEMCRVMRGVLIEVEPDGGVAMFDTSRDYVDWEQSLSAKRRDTLRYARRRIKNEGNAHRISAKLPEDVDEAFDDFVALENSGWKREGGALAGESGDREILRSLIVSLAKTGDAGVEQLYLGRHLIGAYLWTRLGSTMFWLKTAYSEKYSHLSPGVVLLSDLMERCCTDPRIARIDCVSNAKWVLYWGARMDETYRASALNSHTLLGSLGILRRWLRGKKPARTAGGQSSVPL